VIMEFDRYKRHEVVINRSGDEVTTIFWDAEIDPNGPVRKSVDEALADMKRINAVLLEQRRRDLKSNNPIVLSPRILGIHKK